MRRVKKGVLLFVSLFVLLFSINLGMASAADDATLKSTGYCGVDGADTSVAWFLYNDGTLVISGTGEMRDYDLGEEGGSELPPYAQHSFSDFDRENNDNFIRKVIIEEGVTKIGSYALRALHSLENVILPESLTKISRYSFSDCENLTDVTITDNVNYIGEAAFSNCDSIKNFIVSDENPYFTSVSGVLFDNDCSALIIYPSGSTVTNYAVPEGVVTIEDNAFQGNNTIKSVVLPDSVKVIENAAFSGCINLTDISLTDSISSIGSYAFSDCDALSTITLPGGIVEIKGYTFQNADGLKNIVIPENVKSIGTQAFYQCSNLETVIIEDGVTSIGYNAFMECESLKNIDFGNNLKEIKSSAFDECISLKKLEIPASLTIVKFSSAFFECISLEEITVEENNPEYSSVNGVLFNKNKTKLICYPANKDGEVYNIPEGTTSIEENAFRYASGLKEVNIPESVNEIGSGAFSDCINLESIVIPQAVSAINHYTFNNCYNLKNLSLPDSLEKFDGDPFYNCRNIEAFEIPEGIEVISGFYGWYSLESLVLPIGFNSIDDWCFSDTYTFEDIYYKGTAEQLAAIYIGTNNGNIEDARMHYDVINVETHWETAVSDTGTVMYICPCGYKVITDIPFEKDDNNDVPDDPVEDVPDDSQEPEEEAPSVQECNCKCHSNGFMNFIYKILNFFKKIFKQEPCCQCS